MTTTTVEMTKVCALCQTRKPWSQFYARARWDDGTIRCVTSACKSCHNDRRLMAYRANPETKREANRRYRENVRSDPERFGRFRETQRAAQVAYRERRGLPVGTRTPIGYPSTVDVAPFRAWLLSLPADELHNLPAGPEVLRRIRNGRQQSVTLDTVDRCCLHLDKDLNDLYPLEES